MNKKYIVNYFLKVFSEYEGSDFKIEKIKRGFSNLIYKLTAVKKNQEAKIFKVRIAQNSHLICRKNEKNILKIKNDDNLLHLCENGDAIYKWIDGKNLKKNQINKEILRKIFLLSNEYHEKNIENIKIIKHNDLDYYEKSSKFIDEFLNKKYIYLVEKHKKLKIFLTHNDISLKNIIISSNGFDLFLIDYEWGRINNKYWDLSNFCRDARLPKKLIKYLSKISNLDYQILLNFLFITAHYSLQMSYMFPQTNALLKYRKKLNKLLREYFLWIN